MAIFIGSNRKSDNRGEDYVLEKCIEYFDDSCIIYRNREIFGTQFDLCVLVPNQGILIIEVKAWKAASIERVENGDTIVLRSREGADETCNPTKQARGYMFSMKNKIRQKTGRIPYVLPLVCFPYLSEQEYAEKHIEPVCEYETTLLKEDLCTKAGFYKKLNLAMQNGQRSLAHSTPFTPPFMLQVRQIFESVLGVAEPDRPIPQTDTLACPQATAYPYSLFQYIPATTVLEDAFIHQLCETFCHGTKLYLVVGSSVQLVKLAASLDGHLRVRGLVRNGNEIQLGLDNAAVSAPTLRDGDTLFRAFNCLICIDDANAHTNIPAFTVTDGAVANETIRRYLVLLGRCTSFNFEQYEIEHALVESFLISSQVSKARMLQLREEQKSSWRKRSKITDTSQAKELQAVINRELAGGELTWNQIILDLRTVPVMQVIRRIYAALKPWVNYGKGDAYKQDYYRENVDLLFEQFMTSVNLDVLTINTLVDILLANIRSCKNVDSRTPDAPKQDIAIECITVHKSKGLEYGAVILPYCSYPIDRMKTADLHISAEVSAGRSRIGYKLQLAPDATLQNDFFDTETEKVEREREEMRILYVAMTRAIRSFSWLCIDSKKTTSWQKMIWEAKG